MKLRTFLLIAICFTLSVGQVMPTYADDAPPPQIKPSDILPYLDRVIAWRKSIINSDVLPDNGREAIIKEKLHANSKQALDKAVEFARAESEIFGQVDSSEITPEEANTRRGRILKALADVKARTADIQSQLNATHLSAGKKENLNGQLKLARAQQELIQTMASIFVTQEAKSGRLIDQINSLAHTASDDSTDQPASVKPASATPDEATKDKPSDHNSEQGIFYLCGTLFTYGHKSSAINDLSNQTADLIETNHNMVMSVRSLLKDALAQGNALSTNNANDAKAIAAYHKQIDDLIAHYKQLSSTIVPLGEMIAMLETDNRHLKEWASLINEDWKGVFHQLMLRLFVLAIGIAIPIFLSKVAYRTIKRYVQEPRRQRQLRIGTQILLYASLTFVILANFITEFGSLATFAGFITAGLAVALQTVLVSLVAHFFFYGRYGVRVGDRITVADVTGDIVQIGMLRIYLRQYVETETGLKPSGKLVAFPNSILFQPAAFYKHIDEQEIKKTGAH